MTDVRTTGTDTEKFPHQKFLKEYTVQFDGLRCFAIIMVLFSHWMIYPWLKEVNSVLGYAGVNLFFTLSGFLIARILIIQKASKIPGSYILKSFFARRILRIFPLYYLILIIGIIFSIPGAKDTVFRLATFSVNIPSSDWRLPPLKEFTHFWSLSGEEQFYVLFAFLILLFPLKLTPYLSFLMIIAGPVVRYTFFNTNIPNETATALSYKLTISCFDSFGAGILLAWFAIYNQNVLSIISKNRFLQIASFLLLIGISLIKIKYRYYAFSNIFFRLLFSLWFFVFLAALYKRRVPLLIDSILSYRWVVYVGKISYGIYILHYFLMWLFIKIGLYDLSFRFAIPLYAALFFFISIGLAALSWRYFEAPVNRYKRYFPYLPRI